jgi:hypothetical protein
LHCRPLGKQDPKPFKGQNQSPCTLYALSLAH